MRWVVALQVCLSVYSTFAYAQDARRRTLLVVPNQPVEKAPTILVHKDIATTLVFEEAPKAVKIEGGEGRIDVHTASKNVVVMPLVELGTRERLSLIVTARDDARLVFGVEDGFNAEVDSQIIVRRGRAAAQFEANDCFASLLLSQSRQALAEVGYRRLPAISQSLEVEGVLTGLGYAVVVINVKLDDSTRIRVRLRGEESGELEVIGMRPDNKGLLVAVKRPVGPIDTAYTMELEQPNGPTLVSRQVELWPTATAQRMRK